MDTLTILRYYVFPLIVILCSLFLGRFLEKRGLARLRKFAVNMGWKGSEIIIESLQGMIFFWLAIGSLYLAVFTIPITNSLRGITAKVLLAIFLGSLTILIAKLAVGFIQLYSSKGEEGSQLTSLLENLTRLLIFIFGFLIIIQSVGIPITALLTALGIGGVSIGLALQSTLANLFSGIGIITSRKVRMGDYIKLESGQEGYVTDIAWRQTVIRDIYDNLIVIPNAKILEDSFKNYHLPEKEMLVPIEVGVSYDSDLEQVEAVTLEVAREVMENIQGGVVKYKTFIRYHRFDYFSINFTVYLRVQEFFDHLLIRHEFIKRLYKRYKLEGITIPFPIQNIYLEDFKPQMNADERR